MTVAARLRRGGRPPSIVRASAGLPGAALSATFKVREMVPAHARVAEQADARDLKSLGP